MHNNECEPMFVSFFVVLGLFLLLAVKRPSAHRSLIAFAAWWSLFHATVMAIQTFQAWNRGIHRQYMDVVIAGILGCVLLSIQQHCTPEALQQIPNITVELEGGHPIEHSGPVEIIDFGPELGEEGIQICVCGIPYPLYGELFPQHVAVYRNQFK